MKCVILQPSYIPWRGFFHQIAKADIFVFYDDVQYDKHGWRNRNRIKTSQGVQWLTIPVLSAGAVSGKIPINQVRINWDRAWNETHLATLRQSYTHSPFFKNYEPLLQNFFGRRYNLLADFTIDTTIAIARTLGITNTRFVRSSDIKGINGTKTDRLVSVLNSIGATHYISGPSAASYLEKQKLQEASISIEFMEYSYPAYPQLYPPFDPFVSILDLLFMTGDEAIYYIVNSEGNQCQLKNNLSN
jgi:hypothetical protein